jgi:hypothetical protein
MANLTVWVFLVFKVFKGTGRREFMAIYGTRDEAQKAIPELKKFSMDDPETFVLAIQREAVVYKAHVLARQLEVHTLWTGS